MRLTPPSLVWALLTLAVAAASSAAQPARAPRLSGDVRLTGTRLDVSPPWGPAIPAVGIHATGRLRLRGAIELAATAGSWLPSSVYAVTPGCTSLPCQGASSPERMDLVSLHVGGAWFDSRFRVSAGVGTLRAERVEPGATRSTTRELAVDVQPFGPKRWRPVVGLRVINLATPISGVRTLIAPGVGLAF